MAFCCRSGMVITPQLHMVDLTLYRLFSTLSWRNRRRPRRVHAFLKGQVVLTAQVIALPVAGAVRPLAPVFLHIGTVDHEFVGGALVEPGEVPAQHQEVGPHGQGQGHVEVKDDAAVGADGHIDAGLLEILIPGRCHLDEGGGLAAADALGLPGDADGAAADAYLHKVGPGPGRKRKPSRSTTLFKRPP